MPSPVLGGEEVMTRNLRTVVFQDQMQSHEHYYFQEKKMQRAEIAKSLFFLHAYKCLKVPP